MPLESATDPRLQTPVSAKQSDTRARSSVKELEQAATDCSSALYRIALRQLGNHEDAEDAVQDALVSAFCHLAQFEGRSQMSTWLVRIVINAARMSLRKRPRQVDGFTGQEAARALGITPSALKSRVIRTLVLNSR